MLVLEVLLEKSAGQCLSGRDNSFDFRRKRQGWGVDVFRELAEVFRVK
jgi:hypothetical protein